MRPAGAARHAEPWPGRGPYLPPHRQVLPCLGQDWASRNSPYSSSGSHGRVCSWSWRDCDHWSWMPAPRLPTPGSGMCWVSSGTALGVPDTSSGTYVHPGGEVRRDMRYITTRITADGRDGYPVEPGRYRLVVSRACPWANRAIIVRRLLGLEDVLSMGVCGPTHDARSWTFDLDPGGRDPVLGIERLQQAYLARFPGYDRG